MIKKDTCEIYCYDEEKVNRIQGNLQTVDISSFAQMLKAIADKNRARFAKKAEWGNCRSFDKAFKGFCYAGYAALFGNDAGLHKL